MKLVSVGGRVKSAAVGLNHLYLKDSVVELNDWLSYLRRNPSPELFRAFFPNERSVIKGFMKGVGFYRPVLKTDQGMAGNFLPFLIDPKLTTTDLSVRQLAREEGVALPEPHWNHDPKIVSLVQKCFSAFNLEDTARLIQEIGSSREAVKGRIPFFLIRPAVTDRPIVFGCDIIHKVTVAVNSFLSDLAEASREEERKYCGSFQEDNLLYCQADVFILSDGTVIVEKINCPDVGLFLLSVQNPFASILPQVQDIVRRIQRELVAALAENIKSQSISILTRDEVLEEQEDVLEIWEIEQLRHALCNIGKQVGVYSVSQVGMIPRGQTVILLNIDYSAKGVENIFRRHSSGELIFYPNPFFQVVSQKFSGLQETSIPREFIDSFLKLVSSSPKDGLALMNVWGRINKLLCNSGVHSDILHADIGYELIPVFRRSLHSWRQINRRANRYMHNGGLEVKLKSLPVVPDKLLITSDTGPRIHTFRFMFVK
jgi:hypothetical protein